MFEDDPTQVHPGFTPKRTVDTLLDYDPSLGESFAALPMADIKALPALIEALEDAREEASGIVGAMKPSDPGLGLPDKVYRPSREELLEAELGRRLKVVVASFPPSAIEEVLENASLDVLVVTWRSIEVKHVGDDLQRVYYVIEPVETDLDLV